MTKVVEIKSFLRVSLHAELCILDKVSSIVTSHFGREPRIVLMRTRSGTPGESDEQQSVGKKPRHLRS